MVNVMTVRASSLKSKQNNKKWVTSYRLWLAGGVLLAAGAATLAFDAYSGGIGIFTSGDEIIPTGSGRIIRVAPGGSIQAALNRAEGGDTIELQAGAVYKGPLKLPKKVGSEFITIRTSAKDSELPAADTRLDPKKHASELPKIVSNVKGEPAVMTADGAHHYRFIGIEFGPTIDGLYNIIQLGSTEETTVEQLPHHIEFDRVYVHGSPTEGQRRGIAANGRHIKITNSYFSDFKREGEESQAIAVWAADGPIEIRNNYLEAAAESILFGGAESRLGVIPGNAVIRDNWLNKPLSWRGTKWVVKNFLEIKSGRKIVIENNLMTNNWAMAQEGTGVLFRTGEDSGKNATVEDIEFTNNIIRGSGSAITVFGGEGDGGRRLTIRNNIIDDIVSKKWDGRGYFLKTASWDDLIVENNTVIHDGSIALAYGGPVRGMIFRGNIVFNNEYGIHGDGAGSGRRAIAQYFPGAVITNNAIVGGASSDFGGANIYPGSASSLGFMAFAERDYRLRPESPLSNKGFGGRPIGANLDPATVGGR